MRELVKAFKALSDDTRLRILSFSLRGNVVSAAEND